MFHQLYLCPCSCKCSKQIFYCMTFSPCVLGFFLIFLLFCIRVSGPHRIWFCQKVQPRYWAGSVGVKLGVRTDICWDKSPSRGRDCWRHSGLTTQKIAPKRKRTVRAPKIIQPCGNLMEHVRTCWSSVNKCQQNTCSTHFKFQHHFNQAPQSQAEVFLPGHLDPSHLCPFDTPCCSSRRTNTQLCKRYTLSGQWLHTHTYMRIAFADTCSLFDRSHCETMPKIYKQTRWNLAVHETLRRWQRSMSGSSVCISHTWNFSWQNMSRHLGDGNAKNLQQCITDFRLSPHPSLATKRGWHGAYVPSRNWIPVESQKASFCHSEYKLKEPMKWRCFDSSLRPSHVSHLPGPATLQEVQTGPQGEQFPLSYV